MSWRVGHVFYSPVHILPIFASLAILNKLVWHKPLHITLFLSTLNFLSLSKRTVVVLLLFSLYLPPLRILLCLIDIDSFCITPGSDVRYFLG